MDEVVNSLFIVDVILILQISQLNTVIGTGMRSMNCLSGEVLIDGKCYSSCPDHLPLNTTLDSGIVSRDMQPRYTCVSKCPKNLLRANKSCVKSCPTSEFDFNQSCVKHCPKSYCQRDYLSHTDCIKHIHFACLKKCEDGDTRMTNACLYSAVDSYLSRCHEFCTNDSKSVSLCKKLIQSNDSQPKSDLVVSVSHIDWNTGQVLNNGHECYPICNGRDNILLLKCKIWRDMHDFLPCDQSTYKYKDDCVQECPQFTYAEFGGDECKHTFVFLFLLNICAVLLSVTVLAIISIYCGDCIFTCNQYKVGNNQAQGSSQTQVFLDV